MEQRYIIEPMILGGGFEVVDSEKAHLIAICYTKKDAVLVAGSLNNSWQMMELIQDKDSKCEEMGG